MGKRSGVVRVRGEASARPLEIRVQQQSERRKKRMENAKDYPFGELEGSIESLPK